jgi:hypothetical protein
LTRQCVGSYIINARIGSHCATRIQKNLGLERVKKWLYAKGLDERSSGSVLCGSCYGHGPANPMEDVPGPNEKCAPYEFYRFQRLTPKSRWLMAQRVFHGLDPITPELKEIIYSCYNLPDVPGALRRPR